MGLSVQNEYFNVHYNELHLFISQDIALTLLIMGFRSRFNSFTSQRHSKQAYVEREGTMGYLLHKSLKFYNNVFLFVGLTILGAFN